MPDQIKTVTEKGQFQFLLDNFFTGHQVYIKTSSGALNLQYLGYSEGNVAFRIPHVKSFPENAVVFTRHGGHTIYLSMKHIEKNEDTFVFIPIKFQIISETRKEDRKLVDIEGGKSVIYMNNFISDYIIERGLATSQKKIDKVKEIAEFELKKKFDHVKITFINEAKSDPRLNHALNTGKLIYIPNLNENPDPSLEEDYNYYLENIYKTDISLTSRNRYISEVLAPVMYNFLIPYGYVQVNSAQALSEGMSEVCRRMAIVIDQLFKKNGLFCPLETKFLVADLSKSGMGFVFKEKKYLRYFEEKSRITYDIMLPTRKKAVISAIVRNITFIDNNVIKVGCEITAMDDNSRANYEEYINISAKNPAAGAADATE
ncbi:MAG TPA: PilZ domain-containing protein [Spirochaetota bacterium]|nr:PilZ domain-containing protein [Spirochaetota bacterium]